ncbi:MAG: hypothetical protein J6U37_01955, partial [Lachnospiraceae bacterium]|nr:hypothetical protein [Lachnospiraceae bacterium]
DLNKMEILAVHDSEALKSFSHRQAALSDYSAGEDNEDTKVYELWYDGSRRILLSLNEDFMAPILRFWPNKVKKN